MLKPNSLFVLMDAAQSYQSAVTDILIILIELQKKNENLEN